MQRVRHCGQLAAMLLMGLLGGALVQWVGDGPAAQAQPADAGAGRVVARMLVLQDEQGRERGRLTVTEAGPCLVLLDESSQPRLELGQISVTAQPHEGTDWWGLALHDATGTNRFTCGAQADGSGSGMGVWDNQGTLRYGLGFTDKGNGGLTMNDTQGRPRFGIGMAPSTGYSMGFQGEDGEVIWSAPPH